MKSKKLVENAVSQSIITHLNLLAEKLSMVSDIDSIEFQHLIYEAQSSMEGYVVALAELRVISIADMEKWKVHINDWVQSLYFEYGIVPYFQHHLSSL